MTTSKSRKQAALLRSSPVSRAAKQLKTNSSNPKHNDFVKYCLEFFELRSKEAKLEYDLVACAFRENQKNGCSPEFAGFIVHLLMSRAELADLEYKAVYQKAFPNTLKTTLRKAFK